MNRSVPEGSLSPDCLASPWRRASPRAANQDAPSNDSHGSQSRQCKLPLPTFRLLSAVGREPAQNAKQQSHSARRHNSAAHRALKSARPRSRHARTQNNAPRTNQGHSLRGNNSAARRASAPARDIAPVCGRGPLCRPARTGPQPRPLMSQRGHATQQRAPKRPPRTARRPGARCHHRDGPTAGKKPSPRHDDPNDTTAEAARARWGEGRIWRAPALAAVAFSESSTIGRTTAGGAWTPAAARQSAIPCRIAWTRCTMPSRAAKTCPTTSASRPA